MEKYRGCSMEKTLISDDSVKIINFMGENLNKIVQDKNHKTKNTKKVY